MSDFAVYWRIALYIVLIAGAVSDVRRFEIPNKYPIAVLALFGVAFLFTAPSWEGAFWHEASMRALGGLAAFVVGFLLFVFRIMGGGDAKLFMALGWWFGWPELAELAVLIALAGLPVGVGAAAVYYFRDRAASNEGGAPDIADDTRAARPLHPLRRALRRRAPYGVAICIGAIAAGELHVLTPS